MNQMMPAADDAALDRWIARLINPLRTLTPAEQVQLRVIARRLLRHSKTTTPEPAA